MSRFINTFFFGKSYSDIEKNLPVDSSKYSIHIVAHPKVGDSGFSVSRIVFQGNKRIVNFSRLADIGTERWGLSQYGSSGKTDDLELYYTATLFDPSIFQDSVGMHHNVTGFRNLNFDDLVNTDYSFPASRDQWTIKDSDVPLPMQRDSILRQIVLRQFEEQGKGPTAQQCSCTACCCCSQSERDEKKFLEETSQKAEALFRYANGAWNAANAEKAPVFYYLKGDKFTLSPEKTACNIQQILPEEYEKLALKYPKWKHILHSTLAPAVSAHP